MGFNSGFKGLTLYCVTQIDIHVRGRLTIRVTTGHYCNFMTIIIIIININSCK